MVAEAKNLDTEAAWVEFKALVEAKMTLYGIPGESETLKMARKCFDLGFQGDIHLLDCILFVQEVYAIGYAARPR
jgi:hypothetical protein